MCAEFVGLLWPIEINQLWNSFRDAFYAAFVIFYTYIYFVVIIRNSLYFAFNGEHFQSESGAFVSLHSGRKWEFARKNIHWVDFSINTHDNTFLNSEQLDFNHWLCFGQSGLCGQRDAYVWSGLSRKMSNKLIVSTGAYVYNGYSWTLKPNTWEMRLMSCRSFLDNSIGQALLLMTYLVRWTLVPGFNIKLSRTFYGNDCRVKAGFDLDSKRPRQRVHRYACPDIVNHDCRNIFEWQWSLR